MAVHNWAMVAGLAGASMAIEAFIGFGLWFAPGWASRGRGDLSIHVVWPAGLTVIAAAFFLTAAVGVGATLAACYKGWSGRSLGRWPVLLWLVAALTGTTAAAAGLFAFLRAEAVTMWPQGYNP